ncbi:hypothetical protein M3625_07030 [Paenibacillus sp. MER 78]|nr:hypothetical protein [Paenibacillus sp. MER 78]
MGIQSNERSSLRSIYLIEELVVYMSKQQTTEERLRELGIKLPAASNPA